MLASWSRSGTGVDRPRRGGDFELSVARVAKTACGGALGRSRSRPASSRTLVSGRPSKDSVVVPSALARRLSDDTNCTKTSGRPRPRRARRARSASTRGEVGRADLRTIVARARCPRVADAHRRRTRLGARRRSMIVEERSVFLIFAQKVRAELPALHAAAVERPHALGRRLQLRERADDVARRRRGHGAARSRSARPVPDRPRPIRCAPPPASTGSADPRSARYTRSAASRRVARAASRRRRSRSPAAPAAARYALYCFCVGVLGHPCRRFVGLWAISARQCWCALSRPLALARFSTRCHCAPRAAAGVDHLHVAARTILSCAAWASGRARGVAIRVAASSQCVAAACTRIDASASTGLSHHCSARSAVCSFRA